MDTHQGTDLTRAATPLPIPPLELVRAQLTEALCRVRLLRAQLRVSERAARQRPASRQEVHHGAS
jgi:hypothetical protein